MKIYLPSETKAERKARKAKEKALKSSPVVVTKEPSNKVNRYVCCLKYGNKYSSDYVNRLHNMVKRNLKLDYEFVCFTENAQGIDLEIRIEPLPALPVTGWWFKPLFFNPKLGLEGTLLFLDLDMVIFRNIDHLFTYQEGKFCIIRDFNRYIIKNYDKFNSSVFRLNIGQHSQVYADFIKDPKNVSRRHFGDQDWIRHCIKNNFEYWPDEWIQSYKWEMRGKPQFDKKPRGERDFATQGDPVIKDQTKIAVFHGDPNPHNCKDPWVLDNWR